MSNTSRSQSSSPDILGPPGDADYLISSPIKPFTGRQSWLSPANILRQQTPAKRRRASLSPAKSAHSIRFDDVLLPGSPTMKLTGRQRSLSPEKIQSDGNVSPWRIRVTLEATQDEENQTSPSRKRRRPSTVTRKIPLKDERSPLMEKTPGRPRGRPRKSDIQAANGSPWPASPGNTPGPAGTTPRKRGRPRKGTPRIHAPEIVVAEDEQTPAGQPDQRLSPMDMTADSVADTARQWSPIDLAADGGSESDSLGADDLPVAHLRPPTPAHAQTWESNDSREYGRTSYDTPVIGAAEHHFQDNDENIHSTPSKMPSPTRERLASSVRSSRLAGNTSSPTYPTPTPTSSLVEGETQNGATNADQDTVDDDQHSQPDSTGDHEEFDSIMESEGFTMISLDTLPSAKQHGIGSSARIATDNSSKLLKDRENGRIGDRLKRQLPGTIDDLRSDSHSSARPSPVAIGPSPGTQSLSRTHLGLQHSNKRSPAPISYPELPAADSPAREREISPPVEEEQTETAGYPVIREVSREDFEEHDGHVEDDGWNEEEADHEEEEEPDDEEPFMVQSPQINRGDYPQQNSALAGRTQREADWQIAREAAVSRQAQDPMNSQRVIRIDSDDSASQDEGVLNDDKFEEQPRSNSEFASDEEPLEEDLPADEYLNEEPHYQEPGLTPEPFPTDDKPRHLEEETLEEDDDEGSVDTWREEPQYMDQEVDHEPAPLDVSDHAEDAEQEAPEEEDGFDDIWQQEARDHSYLSQHSDDHPHAPAEEPVSPWRRIAGRSADQNHLSSSPAYVTREHGDVPYSEMTHIRKLRDQNVDLSAIMAEEDTPNRARYYNGTSTPRSILSRRSATQQSINGSAIKSTSSRKAERHVRLQPISQSSSDRDSEAVSEPNSPIIPHQELKPELLLEREGTDIGSEPDLLEAEPVQANPAATPNPHQSDTGASASWFGRITSLTPRWLKAPAGDEEDSSEPPSEEDLEDDDQSDQEDLAIVGSAEKIRENMEAAPVSNPTSKSPSRYLDESAEIPPFDNDDRDPSVHEEDEQSNERSISGDDVEDDAVDFVDEDHRQSTRPRPLAVFGYFSDAHYVALRRMYRMAKQHPERFPYYEAPGRADIVGDWMWTSDGHHGVPITEVQFAIIDRFVHDLSRADVQYGGSGKVEWTEADLHRRLVSIIIGEQIRHEQKAKAARGTSVDTWR
ncbi:uncharacterized protein N7459_008526 [Penicillium hispanicum]|uniref:uncharacterized protein n=1 Tax=Penicillium hispanicum TaxID=1080232 RepID=UPI00253FB5BA|nr:uncharacterized protein N7459_008526 [Penicillium hispanicum]KAJ5574099.1 hypothetical protein N7459_008526 [Penicillium hispanicum]